MSTILHTVTYQFGDPVYIMEDDIVETRDGFGDTPWTDWTTIKSTQEAELAYRFVTGWFDANRRNGGSRQYRIVRRGLDSRIVLTR